MFAIRPFALLLLTVALLHACEALQSLGGRREMLRVSGRPVTCLTHLADSVASGRWQWDSWPHRYIMMLLAHAPVGPQRHASWLLVPPGH